MQRVRSALSSGVALALYLISCVRCDRRIHRRFAACDASTRKRDRVPRSAIGDVTQVSGVFNRASIIWRAWNEASWRLHSDAMGGQQRRRPASIEEPDS